jgi:aldehyde dehydrogenase (NAD+)
LLDPPLDAEIMTEEIFGPLLPVITVRISKFIFMLKILTYNVICLFELLTMPFIQVNKIQESIGFINSRPKPLTIYAFTTDDAFKRKIVAETSSGSVIFNDTLVQVMLLLPHLIFIL